MKTTRILTILTMLAFAACSTISTATKDKAGATAQWLVSKVFTLAVQGVVSAATSPADADAKANWLDSFATGIRTNVSVSSDDIREVAAIWLPEKSHWTELAAEIAAVAQDATLTDAQKVEAIATGLNDAAAASRDK